MRLHPGCTARQNIPRTLIGKHMWEERFQDIPRSASVILPATASWFSSFFSISLGRSSADVSSTGLTNPP